MLNRLRQQNQSIRGEISGYVKHTAFGWTSPISWKTSSAVQGSAQQVYDEHCPSPFKIKKKSEVPPLRPVKMSKTEIFTKDPYNVTYNSGPGRGQFTYFLKGLNLGLVAFDNGNLGVNRPPLPASFIDVDTKVAGYLLQRAYSKMSSAEYDFGVTIGEVAETASFLAKPLGGIAKLSSLAFAGCNAIYRHGTTTVLSIAKNASERKLKRLKEATFAHPIDSSLRILDESANHWLAYKFGVLPLIDDIGKALEFKENNVAQQLGLQIARVKGKKIDKTTSTVYTGLIYGDFKYDAWVVNRSEDRHTCGLYFKNAVQAPLVNFMEKLGFAPWQLPSLAYELIPLSFVVDRFIDIKSFVRGNIGSLAKNTLGSYCSRKITTVCTTQLQNVGLDTYFRMPVKTNANLSGTWQSQQLCRLINPDRPNFPVINPYWRDQLIADATNLSLIWGRLRTHVGKLL